MKTLLAIGEALIDFIPGQMGCQVKDVESFFGKVGGAPANVCGAYTILGGNSKMITQLGKDPFGDKIVEELNRFNISTNCIARTNKANTSLAFVSLQENGNREFSFYRNPSADMLFTPEQVKESWFEDGYGLHFCSVSLGNFPMKEAHKQAIAYAQKQNLLISFDPNIRLPLWNDHEALRQAVLEFIPFAHVLKISDEEVEFITGYKTIEDALDSLFVGNVEMIVYTAGSDGAQVFTKTTHAFAKGEKVKAEDTTGAGDGFIGSFLYQLAKDEIVPEMLSMISSETLEHYLMFSNRFCAYSVQKKGAISSYPTMEEMCK